MKRKFVVEIELDNDAFDGRMGEEVRRILNGIDLRHRPFFSASDGGLLRDVNGNLCGHWDYLEEPE